MKIKNKLTQFLLFLTVSSTLSGVTHANAGGSTSVAIAKKNVRKKGKTMYTVKEHLKPKGLVGISDEQINDHWKLYEGYVKQVNGVTPDQRHRYGFEYNGMVLHELYFENLIPKGTPLADKELQAAIEQTWGSVEAWQKDFESTGKSRGIGWAILYMDPTTKKLTNHFVTSHQNGHVAGYVPLLVMDVWEHAYMVDHKAGGRGNYITAFLQNINWDVVATRFKK